MIAFLSQKSKSLGLFPDTEPDTDVVHDDIEKKEIAEDSGNECGDYEVDDAVPLPFGLVQSTHPLPTEIEHDAPREKYESKPPKHPLILSIEHIGQ